jgi:hypothetical protein
MTSIANRITMITQSGDRAWGSGHGKTRSSVKERRAMEKKGAIIVALAGLLVCGLAVPSRAQFSSGSSGVHGVFPPTPTGGTIADGFWILWNVQTGMVRFCSDYSIGTGLDVCNANSSINLSKQIPNPPTNGVYHFQSFSLPASASGGPSGGGGRALVIVGSTPNMPLSILSQGDITFPSPPCCSGTTMYVRGEIGKNPPGGTSAGFSVAGGKGGPGAFDGGASGNGGSTPSNGSTGFGPSGGAGGLASAANIAGILGSSASAGPLNPSLSPLSGGAGGGGAAGVASGLLGCPVNTVGWGGGSGGGGGGALLLAATGKVVLAAGTGIHAMGGNGGDNNAGGPCRLQGGGGAGGSVRIVATEFTGSGQIFVGGGFRPDQQVRASGGFVRIEAGINTYNGTIDGPAGGSFLSFPTAPIPTTLPTLRITSVAGTAAPQNPNAGLITPDITFANAIQTAINVAVAASNVPLGTTVNIKVIPATGSPTTGTTSGLAGSVASSTASAMVTLPPGAGVITATATFNTGQQALNMLPLINGERPAQVEVVAEADGTSRTYLIAKSGARFEVGQSLR